MGPFPTKEAELNNYFGNSVPYLVANATRLGVSTAHVSALNIGLNDWGSNYSSSTDPNLRTRTITLQKDASKKTLMDTMREVFDDIPQSKLTTADRNTLHLPERQPPSKAPIPDSRPVVSVNTSERRQHTITFKDNGPAAGHAKPHGVRGCQIWVYISADGTEPTPDAQYHYLATDTASPYVATYEASDGGKNAYYMLRWENTRGETGPWSETVMATITA